MIYKTWATDPLNCPECGHAGEVAGLDMQLAGVGELSVHWTCAECAAMWTTEFRAKYSHRCGTQWAWWKEEEE